MMNAKQLQDSIAQNGLEVLGVFYGSYKGFVHSNADPKGLGRIKVKCPEIYGDEAHDYWAYPKSPYVGKGRGSYFIPEDGDTVWISFEKGDPRFPIWEGGWWTEEAPSNDPKIKRIRTVSGLQLTFNDKDENIEIKTETQTITLDQAGKKSSWKGADMLIELDENTPKITVDQGSNKLTLTPDELKAERGGRSFILNDTAASVVSDKVSIGKQDTSTFKAVEGETLKGLMDQLIEAILQMTVSTGFGPSSTVINPQPFIDIKNQLDTFLSDHVTID